MGARLPSAAFDPLGRTLTVCGTDQVINIQIEGAHKQRTQSYELDPDGCVNLAAELLERAVVRCDCDEITEAVNQLRALAAREKALYGEGG